MSTLRFVLPLLACTLFGAEPGGRPYLNEIRIQRHVAIPMRDGVKLYADLYLPAQPGNYPTIVTRTPYGVQRDGVHQEMVPFAQRGYAVVRVDVRGRYESEGLWNPFHDAAKDGYDIVDCLQENRPLRRAPRRMRMGSGSPFGCCSQGKRKSLRNVRQPSSELRCNHIDIKMFGCY